MIIAWLYNRSGGSVFVVMLFHFTSHLLGAVMAPVFTGGAWTLYRATFMGLAAIVALAILQAGGLKDQRARPTQLPLCAADLNKYRSNPMTIHQATWLRRHSLALYFILTCVISWSFMVPVALSAQGLVEC